MSLPAFTMSLITGQKTEIHCREEKWIKNTLLCNLSTCSVCYHFPSVKTTKVGNILKNTMVVHFCFFHLFPTQVPSLPVFPVLFPGKLIPIDYIITLLCWLASYWQKIRGRRRKSSRHFFLTPSSSVLILWKQPQPSHQTDLPPGGLLVLWGPDFLQLLFFGCLCFLSGFTPLNLPIPQKVVPLLTYLYLNL